jgi:hypothetical protein
MRSCILGYSIRDRARLNGIDRIEGFLKVMAVRYDHIVKVPRQKAESSHSPGDKSITQSS